MNKLREKWTGMSLTLRASAAYMVCSILQRCISLITMPLFTRLLTTKQYGQVMIYQSWQGILSIFLTLNLAYGSFSAAMVKFEDDRDGYISAVQGICVALSCAFMLIYLPFQDRWNALFELPTHIMSVMVAETLGSTALLLWSGKKRFEFKYRIVIAVTLGIAFFSPVAQFVLVTLSSEKGYARIIGAALVSILVGGILFGLNTVRGKKSFDRAYWKYALGFNVPLLTYYLSQIIFNQSDRIMISHMIGTDKAAIYGVAYSLATVLLFVLNAINNAYLPWYYGKIKEGKTCENRMVSLAIAGILALLLLAIVWFSPEIIMVMAGEKYAEAVYVVPPVAISLLLLFYSQLFINVEFYYEEKNKLVSASVGAAVANLFLNWIFIRKFGFVAAAYTTLASYMILAVANHRAMKEVLRKRGIKDDGFSYGGLIALFVGFTATSYLGVSLYKLLIPRIVVMLLVLLLLWLKRGKLISMAKRIQAG